MKANAHRLWVATFRDAAKYARERMASTVATRRSAGAIDVTVTHTLDAELYDLPLTARTRVPPDWTSVRFTQGPTRQIIPVHREAGNSYAMYRIVPNGRPARLERGS